MCEEPVEFREPFYRLGIDTNLTKGREVGRQMKAEGSSLMWLTHLVSQSRTRGFRNGSGADTGNGAEYRHYGAPSRV